jgi:hypothetical protein
MFKLASLFTNRGGSTYGLTAFFGPNNSLGLVYLVLRASVVNAKGECESNDCNKVSSWRCVR